ncbi:MAG: hypothetical protein IPL73_23235 [Candidatus Obscuribacter sp.]|nr:hypothetical protein [Candidatus Obscuribacter sp.]
MTNVLEPGACRPVFICATISSGKKEETKSRSQEGLQEQTSQSLKIIKNPGKLQTV